MKQFLVLLPFLILGLNADAQLDTVSVKTIKGITDKMLEIISVEIGEAPDWDNYRNLFLATATKTSLRPDGKPGRQLRTTNLEEFIRKVGPLYARDGFYEYATGLEIQEYNGIATAFQSYYCKNLKGTFEATGINCYQLVYADNRWWIANTTFVEEDKENPIPSKYRDKEMKND